MVKEIGLFKRFRIVAVGFARTSINQIISLSFPPISNHETDDAVKPPFTADVVSGTVRIYVDISSQLGPASQLLQFSAEFPSDRKLWTWVLCRSVVLKWPLFR